MARAEQNAEHHIVLCTRRLAFDRRMGALLGYAGYTRRLGWPRAGDAVGVWGCSPYAWRGERLARAANAPLIRLEDVFLRSLHPGRSGDAPLGLLVDRQGIYYDAAQPSEMETRLAAWQGDAGQITRAAAVIERLKLAHLSKYAATRLDLAMPDPGFVLVVDQTRSDASITGAGATAARFAAMLAAAQAEFPDRQIVVKTHPETALGLRAGHFGPADAGGRVTLLTAPISPWLLFERAHAVYTVASLMGFEAILAGHRPILFGQPFYCGWGLSDDRFGAPARRGRALSPEALAHVALIDLPVWHDPYHHRRAEVETVIDALEAQSRAWREDHRGWVAAKMRLWKRAHLNRFFGQSRAVRFAPSLQQARPLAQKLNRPVMVWGAADQDGTVQLEDGFLRSRGLGAALVPPLSLVLDDQGMYYDPTRPSRLEGLIAASVDLPDSALRRAEMVLARLRAEGASKYNLAHAIPALPEGHLVVVAGQVADDASIRLGAGAIRDDAALLKAARQARPDAVLIYKPHPDVVAGLREGGAGQAAGLADLVLTDGDPAALLERVDELWTITSLMGFEALCRGVQVTVMGMPFYAGWGLTRDAMPAPARRQARPSLAQLIHATLIEYPRYLDPQTGLACPPEIALDRLRDGRIPRPSLGLRLLAKAQGALASQAWLWR